MYFTYFASHVHFSCLIDALHIVTSCTYLGYSCHALVYILFHHPSHVMLTLYFVVLYFFKGVLSFVWTSFSHSSCTPHASLPLFISSFLSLLALYQFVYSWQKGGEYTREYTREFCHFYMTLVHILRERNSISCAQS